jgi:glucose/arabinose dehydrogenase
VNLAALAAMRSSLVLTASFFLTVGACSKQPAPKPSQPEQVAQVVPAEGKGESTEPRVGPNPEGQPVETAPPNVPEFKPAFVGQTRARAVHTRSRFRVTEMGGPFAEPWALAFLPDNRLLVTEKHAGRLLLVSADGKKKTPVQGVPRVDGRDQGGLLDVELSPGYANDKQLFVSYYEPREGGNGLAVARARLVEGAQPTLQELQVIFRMMPTLDSTMHAGGRLVFAPDGLLFVTLGERSVKEGRVQARDLGSHFGKVVRILPDGKVPKDNPFVAQKGARPEIWTSGHRNVLAADLDAQNRLWVVEMGPRGGDELNLVQRGKDYGWPTIGYGEEYSGAKIHDATQAPGLEQPVYYWDPVISPGALTIYDGKLFPEWKGNFFVAGLSSKALIRLVIEQDKVVGEERLLTDRRARIREVVQGPEDALYLLTDGEEGQLLKLTPET